MDELQQQAIDHWTKIVNTIKQRKEKERLEELQDIEQQLSFEQSFLMEDCLYF